MRHALASITPGLESALLDELTDLGIRGQVVTGGVQFAADPDAVMVVNLHSRIAARVTVQIGTCKAGSLAALAHGVRSMSWRDWVHPGQTVEPRVTTHGSRLRNRNAIASKISLAIKDALRGPRRSGRRPPREPASLVVRIERDRATVSIDSSGELLHRRGWRKATAKAPLRENLAAAILRLSGWAPDMPLVDPMCGAGTFPIEAATIAAGRPPGAQRSFALERWPGVDDKLFRRLQNEARQPHPIASAIILAADRDPGAVRATRSNAGRASVEGRIQVQHCPFAELEPPAPTGLVVMNPPYGTRIGKGPKTFQHITSVLRERWEGWQAVILAPDKVRLGLDVERLTTFSNGGIQVHVWRYRGTLSR